MHIGIAHKGKTGMICRCYGVEAHSALTTKGLNAIYLASDMITEIRRIQSDMASGRGDDGFSVPHTTLHVGTIRGGTALNIIPSYCEFKFEIRNLAADDADALLERIRQAAGDIAARHRDRFDRADVRIEVFNRYPALEIEPDAKVVDLVGALVGHGDLAKIDFGTEAGLFRNRLGIPVVVCGPGSMDQGHKPDEFILRSELDRCDRFLSRLVDRLCQ